MTQSIRKAQPECLRYFLKILCTSNGSHQEDSGNVGREESASVDSLVDVLIKNGNYSTASAKESVVNALRDGLLMPVSASPRSSRSLVPEQKRLRLPTLEEIKKTPSHDLYCYECHLPGMLEECRQCWRSFHRLCYRKNPERPNYAVPSSRTQKNRLPAFSSDTESETDAMARCSTGLGYESDRANSALMQLDQNSTSSWAPQMQTIMTNEAQNENLPSAHIEGKPLLDDLENKTKVEVVCLGEIRPPDRKRPNTTASNISYKSEVSPSDEDEHDLELCTSCRLLKRADLRNPANLQADELCHLVNYTFTRNQEWLANDIPMYLDAKRATANEINIISRLLLHSRIIGLNDVAAKLERKQYTFLMEFLVDLLDIQHSIGIFFGPYSTEIESTKWLLRDITHDLSEIRRCADCFRYSHEKQSAIWFAKPCVQRHELVYAKHCGFPYWPAKVIRVLPNNKFDVRFFGGSHSRALIDVRFIKPIDADTKSLKLGNRPAIKKAMEELRYHQLLSTYPPSAFSFHANPQYTEEIVRTVLGTSTLNNAVEKSKRKRRNSLIMNKSVTKVNDEHQFNLSQGANINDTDGLTSNLTTLCTEVSVSLKRLKMNNLNNKPVEENNNEASKRPTRKTSKPIGKDDRLKMLNELEFAHKLIKEYKQKNEKLEAQKRKLKETLRKQELERKILKRKQWCYWCLEEAIYLCCFRAAYCSEICQARHWKDGHSKVCKNQSESKQTIS